MSKEGKKNRLWIGLGITIAVVAIAVVIAMLMANAMKGETTGDLVISGGTSVDGLICKDRKLEHPAFKSKPAITYLNTVTAIFRDNKLSSISLLVDASYESAVQAEDGMNFGKADYNLTLTNKYGEKADIFSANFTLNGAKLQLAQTTRDIDKINAKTVTYFLLDEGTSISKTFDGLKKQFESKGFTCEKSK